MEDLKKLIEFCEKHNYELMCYQKLMACARIRKDKDDDGMWIDYDDGEWLIDMSKIK